MFFSSKITNSIFSYFDREGISREVIYAHSDWPEEFFKDPSCWIEAPRLENLLRLIEKDAGDFEKIGHASVKLRAWGPLDSVLKLMSRPQDILSQPDRFLSYFISPPPPIDFIDRSEESVSFRIPISSEEYPLATRYLKAAFESLPSYVGAPVAQASWKENVIDISWASSQDSFLEGFEGRPSPELIRSLSSQLEKLQKTLEEKSRLIEEQKMAMEVLKRGAITIQPLDDRLFQMREDLRPSFDFVAKNISRLHDYMIRAQQLVTVLSASQKGNHQVQQAMHRVDWELLTKEFPQTMRTMMENVYKIQDLIDGIGRSNKTNSTASAEDQLTFRS